MSYYEDLGESNDPARRMGWLRRVGQAFRFECVRQLLQPGDRVVDLGCGDAALAFYLAQLPESHSYVGVEKRTGAAVRPVLPQGARVVNGNMFEFAVDKQDLVVGLGCLVDGDVRPQSAMRQRAVALATRMQLGRAGILIAVDLDAVPEWRRDGALGGARSSWFGEPVELLHPCRDEIAMVWGGHVDVWQARRAVATGPWSPWDPAELAWLAERCGALEEARGHLEGRVTDEALAEVVRERLDSVS